MHSQQNKMPTTWAELVSAAKEAEFANNYWQAAEYWERARLIASISINQRFAEEKLRHCRERIWDEYTIKEKLKEIYGRKTAPQKDVF